MTTLERAAREELGMPEGMAFTKWDIDQLNTLIERYKSLLLFIAENPSEDVIVGMWNAECDCDAQGLKNLFKAALMALVKEGK